MLKPIFTTISILFYMVAPLQAQTVRAERFTLTTGPCTLRSGSGTPEGVVTGKVCDTFWRTDTGTLYLKTSGTGNTGWTTALLTGSGTANTIAMWTGPAALGDSTITQSGGNLVMTPSGDIVTDPTGNDILPVTNYDINIGAPSLKYLSLSVGELLAETLVAQDVLSTIGGRILVAPTTLLTGDLSNVATTITVKHNNLNNGDRIYMQTSPGGTPQVEFMAVTSSAGGSAGAYTYSVTRNLDGSGANTWYAGDAILNTGTTGNGFIDIYSNAGVLSGSGPTIVGNVRTGTTYNNIEPRWAIGNLNGLYGYSSTTYGTAFGVPSAAWVKIDPTNGVRLGYNTTTSVQIDASGNASFAGSITAASGTVGGWTIGSTSLSTGSGATRIVIAQSGLWYGANNFVDAPFSVTPAGVLVAASGTIAGWTINSNQIFSGSGATRVGIVCCNDAPSGAFYAGSDTIASAPFRVTPAGALFATNATITGAITATSGDVSGGIAAGSITASKLNVSTLSAITADLGTVTAGTVTGVTLSGSTVRGGSGNEVELNSTGLHFIGNGGNATIDMNGIAIERHSGSTGVYVGGNMTIEDILVVNGAGAGINLSLQGDLGFGGGGTIQTAAWASSTGTTVIWENACSCLKLLSSSERYKEHIRREVLVDPYALLRLQPIRFDYQDKGVKNVIGFRAEDLAHISKDLVNIDDKGRPDSIRQDAVNVYILSALQQLRAEMKQLEKKQLEKRK